MTTNETTSSGMNNRPMTRDEKMALDRAVFGALAAVWFDRARG